MIITWNVMSSEENEFGAMNKTWFTLPQSELKKDKKLGALWRLSLSYLIPVEFVVWRKMLSNEG